MENENQIRPMLFFGFGQCTECGAPLYVLDSEMTFMELAPSGTPIKEETVVHCKAVCSRCSKEYSVMRKGSSYIPDNGYTRFLKDYRDIQYSKQIEKSMDELKPTEDNPFCIGKE